MSTAKSNEFARGWPVLLAAFLGTTFGASPIPFNIIGFLIKPLGDEFGWNRAEISIGISIFGVTAALLAPVYGSASDRYGVRRVALWSVLAFGLAWAAFAFTPPTLSGYYALWFVLGLVGIGSTPVTWSRAIAMWFVKHRGLALGIMLIGTSLAAAIVPGLAVWAIGAYGWRMMFPIVALLPLLISLPVAFALFREPRADERPAGIAGASGALTGVTLGVAMRDRRFWTMWLSILLIAGAYGGLHIHLPSIILDHGFAAADGAKVMAVVAAGILAGRLLVGAALDRIWAPLVAFPALCLPAVTCWLLIGTGADVTPIVIGGFLLGFAAGAESDLIAFLAARYFGMANYGRIYGMLYVPFGLFSAISPAIYGGVRDRTGSYDSMLTVAIGMFVIGGALLLTLGRYPDRLPEAEPAGTR